MMTLNITRRTIILFTLALSAVHGLPNYPSYDDDALRHQKANDMHKYMNLSIDPCENFYEFACGNWAAYHPANTTVVQTSPLETVGANLNRELLTMVSTYSVNDTATDVKVKDFFQACTNLPKYSPEYLNKLQDIIMEFGRMPVLEGPKWNEAQFDWVETVARIYNKYGIAILLSYSFGVEKRLMISHHELGLELYTLYLDEGKKEYLQKYKSGIARHLVRLLGVGETLAEQTAGELVDFEKALAAGIVKGTTPAGELYVDTNVNEMQAKYAPDLDMKKFLQIVFDRIPDVEFGEKNPTSIEHMVEVLKSTPKRVVANYVFYFLIRPFRMLVPKSLVVLTNNCLEKTQLYFPDAVDNMIYRRTNIRQTEQSISNLFYDLKSIFKSHLNSDKYNWIRESTRKNAIKKLDGMKIVFNSYTDINFDEKYRKVTTNNKDYIQNLQFVLLNKAFSTRSNFDKIEPVRNTNFLYMLNTNTVYIAIPTLQPHYLWSPSYPAAINFGTLGVGLAHEIIHGFDNEGIEVNENGDESNWFDGKSRKAYDERVQCLSEQFSNYTYYGKLFPAMQSQAENIADGGGMRLLYDVYSSWSNSPWKPQTSAKSEMLPGLNYTPEQLLFISYAQLWCTDISPLYRNMRADEHAPESLRVTATVSNFDEFSLAFRCPRGSPMNPEKKCVIY